MSDIEIIEVYEVEGDFGNVGPGRTLGIFKTEAEALENAKGCGSLDGGGDGMVRKRSAISSGEIGRYFLLQDSNPFVLGEMGHSEAKELHTYYDCDAILVSSCNSVSTIRVLRNKLSLSLFDAKNVVDNLPYNLGSYQCNKDIKQALEEIGDIVELVE